MSLEITHVIWDELKSFLTPADKQAAAETLVEILVHHDYEVRDIIDEFGRDAFVREAIAEFVDTELDDEEDEEEDEEEEDY